MPEGRGRRIIGTLGAALGAAVFVAGLAMLYSGMRHVMVEAGGFCATGGPYVIANECTDQQIGLTLGGLAGIWTGGGLYAAFAGWAGWTRVGGVLLMWGALFGALGWNFLELGFDPPGGRPAEWGWLVPGFTFWLMAAGGLAMAGGLLVNWWRRRDEDMSGSLFRDPLVRASTGLRRGEGVGRRESVLPDRLAPPPDDSERR